MSETSVLTESEMNDAKMSDVLIDLLLRVDKLLTECSGRQVVSASEIADDLLDIRQFVNSEVLKLNPDFSMAKIKSAVDVSKMTNDEMKKMMKAILSADEVGKDDA